MSNYLKRHSHPHSDFIHLVEELDLYLTVTDEDEHDFYDQFNSINDLKHIIVAYENEEAVGCGAFRPYDSTTVEIKRMFVRPGHRGTGLAQSILEDLEAWSHEIGYFFALLETGKRQIEAVKFYTKCGYIEIPKYDQYAEMENSLCFKKSLT